jgi:integrase/recombinase XerD
MSVAELNSGLLDTFSDALWLEDGLSRNTLDSYRSDLEQFGAWLAKRRHHDNALITATHSDLLAFIAYKFSARVKASTTYRELSSLKRF